MGLISKLFGASSIVKDLGEVADRFITTDAEKQQFRVELERVLTDRLRVMEESAVKLAEARAALVRAELEQDDRYVKYARPTIIYVGLFAFLVNNVVIPNLLSLFGSAAVAPIELPAEFWYAWAGVAGAYVIGRSAWDKRRPKPEMTKTERFAKLLMSG